jgi:competence protein ComEC
MKDWILYAILAGFGGGVFLSSFFNFGLAFSIFVIFLAILVAIFLKFGAQPDFFVCQKNQTGLFLVPLFIFSAGLGLLRYDFSDFKKGDPVLEQNIGQKISVEGVLSEEPDQREKSANLIIDVDSFEFNGKPIAVKSRALVIAELYPEYKYGDRLKIEGIIKKPEKFDSEGGNSFDYPAYLAKDGIYYQFLLPKITLISSGNGNFIKTNLFALKGKFMENIRAVISEPEASLLGGLVVGAKRSLGKEILDEFKIAGVAHIVVLSGYNITIVSDSIMKIFSFLPRYLGFSLGTIGIILFTIMTGAASTAIRAAIMAMIVILARATGRISGMTRALLIAGFFMVLQNPKILVFDSSFQLSFAATLGLIYFTPIAKKYLGFIPEKWDKFREIVFSTVATQAFVLPLILYKIGIFSVFALPANLLFLPMVPMTMFFGFVTGIVGFLSTALSIPLAYISYFLLFYELKVIEIFSSLPFSYFSISNFPIFAVVFMYGVYLFTIVRLTPKSQELELG